MPSVQKECGDNKFRNPETKRCITIGSKVYKDLLRRKVNDDDPVTSTDVEPPVEEETVVEETVQQEAEAPAIVRPQQTRPPPLPRNGNSVWTSADRNRFIKEAVNSTEKRGTSVMGPYRYTVFPNSNAITEPSELQQALTSAFAKTVYTKDPSYKRMSIGFYFALVEQIRANRNIGFCLWRDVSVIVKGSNAYAYHACDLESFPFSDLDVVININPTLPDKLFEFVHKEVKSIVTQCISQHKRALDRAFFRSGPDSSCNRMSSRDASAFQEDFHKMLRGVNRKLGTREILSPFADAQVRNACSKFSFVLKKSKVVDGVVKVDVPHFEKCETIPLRKTPFFASVNDTIDFDRSADGTNMVGKFDLIRLRFNCLLIDKETDRYSAVTADMIDVGIPHKKDVDLVDFWEKGKCVNVKDPDLATFEVSRGGKCEKIMCWVVVPDIASCIADLDKMMNMYDCPDAKRDKRKVRFAKLSELLVKGRPREGKPRRGRRR